MKFTSTLLAAASGSVGGLTFSHNAGGAYIRRRAVPVNPNTEAQASARENLGAAVSRWTNILTDSQRAAWSSYAGSTPLTDRLGATLVLSGQQFYVKNQTARRAFGLGFIDDGPAISGLGLTPSWTTGPLADPDTSLITGSVTVSSGGTAGDLGVYVSKPVPASRTPAHETRRASFVEGPPVAGVFTVSGTSAFTLFVDARIRVFAVYFDDIGRVSTPAIADVQAVNP